MALFDNKKLNSLEAYCRDRWEMGKSHAYRLMDSASTLNILESDQLVTLPANESQIRPLTKLDPESQREAWTKVIETAPEGRAKASSEAIGKIFDTIEKIGLHIWPVIDYVTPLEYYPIALVKKIDYRANISLVKI